MAELIGPALKDLLQDINESAMPSTCTVLTKTTVRRPSGSAVTVQAGTTYKCRKGTAFAFQKVVGGGIKTVMRWPLTLERSAVIGMAQQIRLADGDYEVVEVSGGDYNFNPKVVIERVGS